MIYVFRLERIRALDRFTTAGPRNRVRAHGQGTCSPQ